VLLLGTESSVLLSAGAAREVVLGSGVNVMITIFCEFGQFSAKNWRFSQTPML
jgi:hypothetical protein